VRGPGETAYIVISAGPAGGIGVARARPLRGPLLVGVAQGEKVRLRGRVEGARVVAICASVVIVDREGELVAIAVEPGQRRVVVRAPAEAELALTPAVDEDREALEAEASRLTRAFVEADRALRSDALRRSLARGIARLERRIAAVRGDLERIGEAEKTSARAALFVAEAARAPSGARSLRVTDWSSGEAVEIELPLDPARPARAQLDAIFRRARRLKVGAAISEKRVAEAESARGKLVLLSAELGAAAAIAEPAAHGASLDRIAAAAKAAAPRDVTLAVPPPVGARRREPPSPRLPYRTFAATSGARILVGRGGADNDALTTKVAKPHDLWLHAKGRTGAHVIVPLDKNKSCLPEVLVDAAHLAAHFSDGQGELVVEIQHTPRRHLTKPRGAAPGLVVVQREKVLVLRVDRERLARLLAAELG
jgi:predicted ribosome quality control (RQC) complex YloA/Tae2 family protein